MTEHEIRVEKLLLENLRGIYFLTGLLSEQTNNPPMAKKVEGRELNAYLKMFSELSHQLAIESPELFSKYIADFNS